MVYILSGCPGKVTITNVDAGFETITIYWKEVKDNFGRPLHIEVKHRHEGMDDWIINVILPIHHSFEATDLPSSAPVDFELRAISYDGVFGPTTKKTVITKGRSQIYTIRKYTSIKGRSIAIKSIEQSKHKRVTRYVDCMYIHISYQNVCDSSTA